MDSYTLRAWWARKQGLDGSLDGQSASAVLERSGWARSVAGVSPYLTLFSRAGIGRAAADAAVANLEIHELPAARGCTYVVPQSDFALALRCGASGPDQEFKVASKLGVTAAEMDRLCDAVCQALSAGTLSTDAIRDSVGPAARSLGPEGVKKGVTTTLPVALGRLQSTGAIRRVPVNGRLDQQRYNYTLWNLPPCTLSAEELNVELARRFFRWIGPATLSEFQWFSGLGVKAAQQAVAALSLAAIDDGLLLFPEDLDALRAFRAPKKPDIRLLGSIDGLVHLRRNHVSLLDSPDAGPGAIGRVADLPSHAITDRGRLIGIWEYDVDTAEIVWQCFGDPPKELASAVKITEAFIRDQVGDARAFSLDSPKSRAPRLAALRAARK